MDFFILTCLIIFYSRSLLSSEELTKLQKSLETDGGILKYSYDVADSDGRNSRACIWNHPGDDVTGMVARSEKVVTTSENVCKQPPIHS